MPDQSNAQCIGGQNCAAGRDICRYVGSPGQFCETVGLGGGDVPPGGGGDQLVALEESGKKQLPHGRFIQVYLCIESNERLEKAGIVVGSMVTHINGQYPAGMPQFSKLAKAAGQKEWYVYRSEDDREFVKA
jgi:hypothetical protein